MRKLLPLLILPILVVSCKDPHAVNQAKVQEDFNKAMEPLVTAQRGYVPGNDPTSNFEEFRLGQQDKAAKSLEMMAADADPALKVAARRTLADIYSSAASSKLQTAVTNWTGLANEASLLLSDMIAIDSHDSQVRRFSVNDTTLVAELVKARDVRQTALDTAQSQLNDLTTRIAADEKSIASIKANAEQAESEQMRLREQALTSSGQQQLDLYNQARVKGQEANAINVKSQNLVVKSDLLKSEAVIVQAQVELGKKALAGIDQQMADAKTHQADMAKHAQEARDAKAASIKTLQDSMTGIVGRFNDLVAKPFGEADAGMAKAIQSLQSSQSSATGPDRRAVQLDLLSKSAVRVQLLTLESVAEADLYRKLNVIAVAAAQKRGDETLMPAQTEFFQSAAASVLTTFTAAVNDAQNALKDASTLAKDLSDGGDNVASSAAAVGEQLKTYGQQINDLSTQIKGGAPAGDTTPPATMPSGTSTPPATMPATTAPGG